MVKRIQRHKVAMVATPSFYTTFRKCYIIHTLLKWNILCIQVNSRITFATMYVGII